MTSGATHPVRSVEALSRSRPVQVGARVGLVAYGVTHLLIAWLALQIAFGGGGQQASQSGAFEELAGTTLGRLLLWVLAAGFVAVALWRLGQAIAGFSYEDDRTTRLRKRASSGARAVLFAALAVLATRTALGSGGGGGGQKATAGLLGVPGGQLLVGAIGLAVLAAGVVKAYAGWTRRFRDDMDLPSDRRARDLAVRSGQVGFIARGIATALVGGLVVVAAVRFQPNEASGLDAALRTLAGQPFGPWLLSPVAVGLAVYGVFCFFDARYHRV